MFIPADADIHITKGQHVLAGETIIARFDDAMYRKSQTKDKDKDRNRGKQDA